MIKSREFGALPGGLPDTGHSEYLRGKLEVRNHASGKFERRGFDVWAERSGRTYHSDGSELAGGADYASPVSGSGMGKLSNLTGGAKKVPGGLVPALMTMGREANAKRGGATDALEIKEMMQRGANRARGVTGDTGKLTAEGGAKKRKPNARAAIVSKVMKERGVSLPEASKIVKAEGLY